MTIRESIISEARELAEGSPSKDTRGFARSVYEYLGKMPHDEAIKTAREACTFEELRESLIKHLEWKSEYVQAAIVMLREIFKELDALDSLAVEPTKPIVSKTCWTCRKTKGDKDCADHDQQYMGGCPCWAGVVPKAVEPSEVTATNGMTYTVRPEDMELSKNLYQMFQDYVEDSAIEENALRIAMYRTSRDERIRRECADSIMYITGRSIGGQMLVSLDAVIATIMGKAKK